MNNNIVFDNDTNSDSNAELLKNNTPNTVDYNELYNTNSNINLNNISNINNQNNNIQTENKTENIHNAINTNNNVINNNSLNVQTTINNQDINSSKKRKAWIVFYLYFYYL